MELYNTNRQSVLTRTLTNESVKSITSRRVGLPRKLSGLKRKIAMASAPLTTSIEYEDLYGEKLATTRLIGAADEAGRGCISGIITCGCVILDDDFATRAIQQKIRITDSKKLSAGQRERAFNFIINNAYRYTIYWATPREVDTLNPTECVLYGINNFIMDNNIQYFIFDGTHYKDNLGVLVDKPWVKVDTMKQADSKSLQVACASILAKVSRDKFMHKVHSNYITTYSFDKNLGYYQGLKQQIQDLRDYGYSDLHRRSYIIKKLIGEDIKNINIPLTEESDELCEAIWKDLLTSIDKEELHIERIRTTLHN